MSDDSPLHEAQQPPGPRLPWLTYLLLAVCGLAFVWQQGGQERWLPHALWPGELFRVGQLLSYGFLHNDSFHLAFNGLGLLSFGVPLERQLGRSRFALLYGVGLLTAAGAQWLSAMHSGELYPTIGASGALFALLFAFAFLFPRQRVMLLIPPIPMPAWLFALFFAGLSLWLGSSGYFATVAHFAHLGGMFGAVLLLPMLVHARHRMRARQAP